MNCKNEKSKIITRRAQDFDSLFSGTIFKKENIMWLTKIVLLPQECLIHLNAQMNSTALNKLIHQYMCW